MKWSECESISVLGLGDLGQLTSGSFQFPGARSSCPGTRGSSLLWCSSAVDILGLLEVFLKLHTNKIYFYFERKGNTVAKTELTFTYGGYLYIRFCII